MIELNGYEIIERIYSGTRTLVDRGTRLCDQKPVAIKVLRNEYPSFSEHVHSQSVHDRQKPEFARNHPKLQLGSLQERLCADCVRLRRNFSEGMDGERENRSFSG